MSRGRTICEFLHVAALAFWLGALVIAGATAAVIFPTMRDLRPHLPQYAAYSGDHWLIAGGRIAAKVFWITDAVQFVCVLFAGLTFGLAVLWFGLSTRKVSTFLRATVLLALVGLLSYRLGFLEPGLSAALREHWAAALAGDNTAAAQHKAVFDAGHPVQTRIMAVTALLVVCAIGSAMASLWNASASLPDSKGSEL